MFPKKQSFEKSSLWALWFGGGEEKKPTISLPLLRSVRSLSEKSTAAGQLSVQDGLSHGKDRNITFNAFRQYQVSNILANIFGDVAPLYIFQVAVC